MSFVKKLMPEVELISEDDSASDYISEDILVYKFAEKIYNSNGGAAMDEELRSHTTRWLCMKTDRTMHMNVIEYHGYKKYNKFTAMVQSDIQRMVDGLPRRIGTKESLIKFSKA